MLRVEICITDFSHRWSSCSTKCFIKRAMVTLRTRRNNTVHWPLNQLQIVPWFCPLLNQQEMNSTGEFWFIMSAVTLSGLVRKADFEGARC